MLLPNAFALRNYIVGTNNKRDAGANEVFLIDNLKEWDCYGYCTNMNGYPYNDITINRLPNSTFPAGLSAYSKLTATNLHIKEIHPKAFDTLRSLRHLNISHNSISKIPPSAFAGTQLETIDLSFNRISYLPENVFFGLNIESVFLHGNQLVRIGPKTFSSKSLQTVTLNENRLTELYFDLTYSEDGIDENFYEHIMKTKVIVPDKIVLAKNPLKNNKEIQLRAKYVDASFTGAESCVIFPETKTFIATNNFIHSIILNATGGHLEELNLSHNNISVVKFLSEFNHLKIIDLSYNQITSFDYTLLDNMMQLETLILSNNYLLEFDFSAMLFPLVLDLSNNKLHGEFKLNALTESVIDINVSNNSFTSVQENLLDFVPNLEKINLNGNRLECEQLKGILVNLLWRNVLIETSVEAMDNGKWNIHGVDCVMFKVDLEN